VIRILDLETHATLRQNTARFAVVAAADERALPARGSLRGQTAAARFALLGSAAGTVASCLARCLSSLLASPPVNLLGAARQAQQPHARVRAPRGRRDECRWAEQSGIFISAPAACICR